jgi:hypothetical protein
MGRQVQKIQKGPAAGLRPGAPTKPTVTGPAVKQPGLNSSLPPGYTPRQLPRLGKRK